MAPQLPDVASLTCLSGFRMRMGRMKTGCLSKMLRIPGHLPAHTSASTSESRCLRLPASAASPAADSSCPLLAPEGIGSLAARCLRDSASATAAAVASAASAACLFSACICFFTRARRCLSSCGMGRRPEKQNDSGSRPPLQHCRSRPGSQCHAVQMQREDWPAAHASTRQTQNTSACRPVKHEAPDLLLCQHLSEPVSLSAP
jgi:hypothetical protein